MASDKTLEMSPKDKIRIDDSVKDMGFGEPQFIGTYWKVVEAAGKEEAMRLYAGMTRRNRITYAAMPYAGTRRRCPD